MRFLAGRRTSASRLLSCIVAMSAFQFAACDSDTPTTAPAAVSPALVDSPSELLSFASGPVVASIKSTAAPTYCIAPRTMALVNGTFTEVQRCSTTTAQQFKFAATTGEIRVSNGWCLHGGSGKQGAAVVTKACTGAANQKWTLVSTGEIKGINGLCVTFK